METVKTDCMQTAVDDAVVDEEEASEAMPLSSATEAGQDEGGAMAIGDDLFEQPEETGTTAMPTGDSAEMSISGAIVTQINGPSEMLLHGTKIMLSSAATLVLIDCVTAMPVDGDMELLSNIDTATQSTSALTMPVDGAIAMPVDGDMKLPSNSATATPTTSASTMPAEGAIAMPVDSDMELPSNSETATPTTGATAISAEGGTAMPVHGNMELPSNSATATPTTGATAISAEGGTAMPVDGDMELPRNSATATPTTGATAIPAEGATAMPVDVDMELPSNIVIATLTAGATAMPSEGATGIMFSIGIDIEPSASDVHLCKICGHRHLLDENHEYNYKDEVDDELTCHICLQPLICPLDTPCGHTYCQECLTNFLVESDFCPVDRVPVLLQNCRKSNVLVHKLLDKLIVICPFQEHCSETMPRGELQGHLMSSCASGRLPLVHMDGKAVGPCPEDAS